MWINPVYRPGDPLPRAKAIVEQNPLGAIITSAPVHVSHMPLQWEDEQSGLGALLGHMPLEDPMARVLATGAKVITVFQGPTAYVSPGWYEGTGLPTFNFSVVHLHGSAVRVDEGTLRRHLIDLVARREAHRDVPAAERWEMDARAEERFESLLPRIMGFRVEIEGVFVKLKLGQNKTMADNLGVIQQLERIGGTDELAVAEAMRGLVADSGGHNVR